MAPDGAGKPDMKEALAGFAARGVTRVLAAGGGALTAALLRDDLVERVAGFHAPKVIGGDGIPAALGLGITAVDQAPAFRRVVLMAVGEDVFETFAREA